MKHAYLLNLCKSNKEDTRAVVVSGNVRNY